jgi:hypothetical protein
MKCPNCLAPVNFSRRECARCGVVYQDVFEKRAREEHESKKKQHARHHRKPRAKALGWLAVPAAAFALWVVTAPPPGLPVPKGAKGGDGYAYTTPEGWSANGSRLTNGTLSAEIEVEPASVASEARSAAQALARSEFNGDEVRVDSVSELEVDRLPAVRIDVSGGRVTLPSTSAGARTSDLQKPAPAFESLPFAGELFAVSGEGCTYVLKIWSDKDTLSRRRAMVERLVGSFRVTRRPRTWGRWTRG